MGNNKKMTAKKGLYYNINQRKKKGISRPKSKSTITAGAYKNMQAGFPKKNKVCLLYTSPSPRD